MDQGGKERWRLEGYLPRFEFRVFLEMGLARVSFMKKNFADAEARYSAVLEHYPGSKYAPEALFWQGVGRYSGTHDHEALGNTAKAFTERYPDSIWAEKSVPWLPADTPAG
jgi:hypothetical protein